MAEPSLAPGTVLRMQYPDAHRLDLVETIHGYRIADPYRWLEQPDGPEAGAWSAAQDDMADDWFARLEGRDPLRSRLHQLMPGFVGPPLMVGERRFFLRRRPREEHAVLWVAQQGDERVLVDPSALSDDDTTTLDGWAPSIEGDLLAYQLSEGGDEESVLRVMDTDTGEVVDGPIGRVRYSPVAWLPGAEALYYVRRLPPGEVPAGEEQFHRRVYLHRIGADPGEDVLVFGQETDKTAYFGVDTSLDGRWLTVTVSLGTAPRNDCYLADLGGPGGPAQPAWRTVIEGADAQAWPSVGRDGLMYLLTDLGAPRRRLVVVDPARPEPAEWFQLLPEDLDGSVLEGVALAGDSVVALRSRHAVSEVAIHDRRTGVWQADVALPGLGTADVTGRPDEGPEAWIGYTDHVTPYRVLHLDIATRQLNSPAEPPGWSGRPASGIGARQVTYRSGDGTEVRMFIVADHEVGAQTPRPAILYGYGGFNISLMPAYSSSILAWVEAGGVYAIANLRGGSEEGEEWHRDGMREHKQNTFDDFAAAAEWLAAEGWTAPDRLAISGGSNGGLLVGAALTQRPELYAAVTCSAPLLDMVRYERFGLGRTWSDEYGAADDPVELGWLLGYSPYHRVSPGTAYPAVLFTVFDGDTRVDPLHARKMCAALQWATCSERSRRPVLFRRESRVGHGARSVSRTIDLAVDTLSFLAGQLDLPLSTEAGAARHRYGTQHDHPGSGSRPSGDGP
jgi:prolyl oligopeptidase